MYVQVKHTSGRAVFKDLMKYENFRQALRFLLYIVQHNPNAASHPAVMRLPEAVREQLMYGLNGNGANVLFDLMASRSVKTEYTKSARDADDVVPILRTGRSTKALQLSQQELKEVEQLVSANDQSALNELLQQNGRVRGLTFVCLPNRSKHSATIYAPQPQKDHVKDMTRVNYSHYYGRCAPPQGSTPFTGSVVRMHHLFMVGDTPLACVSWGQAQGLVPSLECQEYSFPERNAASASSSSSSSSSSASRRQGPLPPCVVKAERLVSYVHFGILPGSRLLLNRFYIPRGLDSDAESEQH